MAKGYYPDLEDEEDASPEEETQSPPNYSGAMPYADENPPYSTPTDPRFRLPNSMPPAEDEPPPEAPRGYAAVLQPGFTRGGMGVPPLRMTDRGPVLSDESGNPITDGTGSPVSLSQYSSRMMANQPRQRTMTPEQEAASWNSSLYNAGQLAGNSDQHANAFAQMIAERQQHLQGQMQQVQDNPYMSPLDKSHTLSHLIQQQGQLAEHWQKVQQQGQRQAATNAGLHPDYGTPNGPELDPRQRQQLAEAEYGIQSARNDPNLSTEQKVVAVTALRRKIESIDPAGRYRNGQNPMSPAEKFAAQNVTFYPEHGLALAVDAKGQPHWQTLPTEKAAKKEPSRFEELPLKERDKLVRDEIREFGIGAPEAARRVKERFAAHTGGGMDQGQQVEDHMAIHPTMQFLHGDRQFNQQQLQHLATRLPADYVRQLESDANEDVDTYMKRQAERRADAIANPGENGRMVVTADPETMKAYQARAKQILAARMGLNVGMGGGAQAGMVAPAPLLPAKQRLAQEAETKKKATEDAKAAEKHAYQPPDLMKLRLQAMNEWKAMHPKAAGEEPEPPTEAWVQAHVADLRKMHRADWEATRPATQGAGDVQGVPLGTTREWDKPPERRAADSYFDAIESQAVRANDGDGQRASQYAREALARFGNVAGMPEPVKQEYVQRMRILKKYDSKIIIPAAAEPDVHDVRQPPPGNTFQSAGKTPYGSTGTYVPRKPHDSGFPGFPR